MELTKAYDAALDIITDGIKGKATVHEEDVASLPNLVVPSDYMYCDKSWYDVYLSQVTFLIPCSDCVELNVEHNIFSMN